MPAASIPSKTRCANCSALAFNAFRLPCCDQNICQDCKYHVSQVLFKTLTSPGQSTLTSTCPVCQHSPISPADCTENKALRLTIKVILKNEQRRREKEKEKEIAAAAAAAAVPVEETVIAAELQPAITNGNSPSSAAAGADEKSAPKANGEKTPSEPQQNGEEVDEVSLDP
jgi:hypothetical protein